jgi:anti-sigma regulatory factor (Ser/Thr protein kinase)
VAVHVEESTFRHEVTFYDDAEQFLASTVPFLNEGFEAGEPALVAVGAGMIEQLRGELGAGAEEIEFANIEEFGRNPARIIPVWQDFVDRQAPLEGRFRGIGEPVWPGRDTAEIDECERHEALLNLAFSDGPGWSLLCPYDSRALGDDVLESALHNHPLVAAASGAAVDSPGWEDQRPEPFAGALPPPPGDAPEFGFDGTTVPNLRAIVGVEAAEAGLPDHRTADLVLATSEVAANSVIHGGGIGMARIWRQPGALVAEVRDAGRLEQPLAGRVRPQPAQAGGRGLWIANQLCDLVQIRSGRGGTRVRLQMNLG